MKPTNEDRKLVHRVLGEFYTAGMSRARLIDTVVFLVAKVREKAYADGQRDWTVVQQSAAMINEQEVRIQRLVEVLRYYADYSIYQPHVADEGFVYVEPLICREDAGQKARDVIKEIAGD